MRRERRPGIFERFGGRMLHAAPHASLYLKARLLCVSVLLILLTACGDGDNGTKVIFTTGFGREDVFRIGDGVCTVPEMMVYLTNIGNQYESVYGSEVWNISKEGVTLEENIKETVLAKLAQIKTMCLLAADRGVALDEAEEKRAAGAAEEYFSLLNATEKERLGVSMEIIEKLYREYALADKVYQYIIQDVRPEISDDEARTITVQHILFRTYTTENGGGRVEYTDKVKETVYEKACEVRRMAVDGEHDFVDLASRYSEDPAITYFFRKGEVEPVIEEAAFLLETGEVSQVIETDAGYHIIKCISTFDREQTDLNKLVIVEERRREIFGQEYDAFVDTLASQLNTRLWDEMTLLHEKEITTMEFFDIYAKYFTDIK